jgi:hypothetical protein
VHRHQTLHSALTHYDNCYSHNSRTGTATPTDAEATTEADAEAPANTPTEPHQSARSGAPRTVDPRPQSLTGPRPAIAPVILSAVHSRRSPSNGLSCVTAFSVTVRLRILRQTVAILFSVQAFHAG